MKCELDIAPQRFWSTLRKSLTDALTEGPEWHYAWHSGPTGWTYWMFPVMLRVCRKLGFVGCGTVRYEHDWIDVTLWPSHPVSEEDPASFIVAIEHESDIHGGWIQEWRKLQKANCCLRVVIGYHEPSRLREAVEQAEQVVRVTKNRKTGPMLLVLGPVAGNPGEQFVAFLSDKQSIVALPGTVTLPAYRCPKCKAGRARKALV